MRVAVCLEVMQMEQPRHTQDESLLQRVQRWFHPGPLDWILGLTPDRPRFHAGEHLHGLDDDGDERARRPRPMH